MNKAPRSLHKDVVERDYKGISVRFRLVEDDVYIAVMDARNLLQCRYSAHSIYECCGSYTKIVFFAGNRNNTLGAILPYDLENLCRGGQRRKLSDREMQKITWLRQVCKEIIEAQTSNPDNGLQIFRSEEFGEIRTTVVDDELLFCLTDVCDAIEITNSRNVKARIDPEAVQKVGTLTSGGNQQITYVTEAGLYQVILRSNSKKSRAFRLWVTQEVIPSIRRTGGYVMASPDDSQELIIARGLMAAKEALERAEQRALIAEQHLALAQPKVGYYDAVIESRELYTTCQIAGELGLSYATLRTKLVELGVVTSGSGALLLTDDFANWGETLSNNPKRTSKRIKWNKEGRKGIFALIDPNLPY